jgi:hypothetical protein
VEEDVRTVENKCEDLTHAPYVACNENRGDVAIDGFWKHARWCIFDVPIDTQPRSLQGFGQVQEVEEGQAPAGLPRTATGFTPLVYSVDAMSD